MFFGVFRSVLQVLQRAFSVASNVYRIRWTVDARTFLVWMKACDTTALENLGESSDSLDFEDPQQQKHKNIALFHWGKKIGHGLDSLMYCKYCRLKPN